MLREVAFSLCPLIGVIIFQWLVQHWLSGKRHIADRQAMVVVPTVSSNNTNSNSTVDLQHNSNNNNNDETAGAGPADSKDFDDRSAASARSAKEEVLYSLSVAEAEHSSSSFDGDEPEIFFELLSQTGCEMAMSYSQIHLVQEQLQVAQ